MSRTIIIDPGLDVTVLTVVGDGTTARSEVPWESTAVTASHVAGLLDSDPGANAVVDVTGVGAAVYDKLRELGASVQPFYPARRSHGIRYAIDEMKLIPSRTPGAVEDAAWSFMEAYSVRVCSQCTRGFTVNGTDGQPRTRCPFCGSILAVEGEEYPMDALGSPARYYADPARFARECAQFPRGKSLAGYQETILWELGRSRRLAVRAPSGAGKTAVAALAVLWFALTREAAGVEWKVIISASTWNGVKQWLWPEIRARALHLRWERLGREPLGEPGEITRLGIHLRHGSVLPVSPDRPDLADTGNCPSVLFVFDAADGIDGALLDMASASAWGAPDGYALAVSTPGVRQTRFRDIFQRPGEHHWAVMHVSQQMAVAAGRMSAQWAGNRAEKWGAGSALYQTHVAGEFPDAQDPDGKAPPVPEDGGE